MEAGSSYSWYKYAGEYGEIIAMDEFGASAPAGALFSHFGFTVDNIVEKALRSMESVEIAKSADPEEELPTEEVTVENEVETDETIE